MAMTSKTNVHGPGSYMMNTGFLLPGFPCMGAWISYGFGSLTDNLPTFVVLPDPKGLPYNQKGNFSAGFLPVKHQGTIINAGSSQPIHDLGPASEHPSFQPESETASLDLLQKMNRSHAQHWPGDSMSGCAHRFLRTRGQAAVERSGSARSEIRDSPPRANFMALTRNQRRISGNAV